MPRLATQPPAPKKTGPRPPPRNPRLIAERPSKSEIRRRHLAKFVAPLSAGLSLLVVALFAVALVKGSDPSGVMGRLRLGLGSVVGLPVQRVIYLNRKQTPQALLDQAMGDAVGTPILNYPLDAARQRLSQIPWIAHVSVERRLPAELVVDLTEHDAFAIWQNQGKFVLIDRTGKPLTDVDVANFKQLPLVVGEGAPDAAPALLDALKATPDIAKLVTAAVRVGARRWDLYLTNNVELLLPQGAEAAALTRLAQLEATDKLFERPLAAIDMRQADKLIIRLRAVPATDTKTGDNKAGDNKAGDAKTTDAKGGTSPAADKAAAPTQPTEKQSIEKQPIEKQPIEKKTADSGNDKAPRGGTGVQ